MGASSFPFLSFPFLISFLGQSITCKADGCPSSDLRHTQCWEAIPMEPLQRGPGTAASAYKYPKSLELQQTDGARAAQILSRGSATRNGLFVAWLSPYFTLEAPFISK